VGVGVAVLAVDLGIGEEMEEMERELTSLSGPSERLW
jgi:hypothetical protein